jgi:hypothetical protein
MLRTAARLRSSWERRRFLNSDFIRHRVTIYDDTVRRNVNIYDYISGPRVTIYDVRLKSIVTINDDMSIREKPCRLRSLSRGRAKLIF